MGRFEAFIGVNFWTALFVLLNTLLIFFVARKYLFTPVMKIITDRRQEIDNMYARAENAREEAQTLQKEYEEQLAMAAATGERIVKEATARAHAREEEILREAAVKAESIRAKASADINREKKKALNAAKDEISVIALAIAGAVVGRELTGRDQNRLVDSFIEELGDDL